MIYQNKKKEGYPCKKPPNSGTVPLRLVARRMQANHNTYLEHAPAAGLDLNMRPPMIPPMATISMPTIPKHIPNITIFLLIY
jgi:hypothetical protein